MNDSILCDDRANDEADRHAQMMQAQRKGRELKKGVCKFDKEHTSWNSNDRRKGFNNEK